MQQLFGAFFSSTHGLSAVQTWESISGGKQQKIIVGVAQSRDLIHHDQLLAKREREKLRERIL
jgi:ABC-type uncharacterized transport system ATPase subunit